MTGDPTLPGVAERYQVLVDLAGVLGAETHPEALYASLHAHLERVIPLEALTIALCDAGEGSWEVFAAGETGACAAFCLDVLDRLRAGEPARQSAAAGGSGRSFLAAPLERQGRIFGYVGLEGRSGIAFDAADAEFLLAAGRIAAMALNAAWLNAAARQRSDEIQRIAAVSRDLSATLELEAVVDRVASHAHQMVGAPVVVWLVEGESARAVARAGDPPVPQGAERALAVGDGAALAARLQAELDAYLRSGSEAGDVAGGAPERAEVSMPLTLGKRPVGFLTLGPWTQPPAPSRIRLLSRLAPHAASAVENARLHAELLRLSLTDPLVQLPNRRQLDLFLQREFAAAARGRALCVILFDLDGFKAYNDAHGHQAGDEVLIRFAALLLEQTRAMNLAARYGGEEFAVVLSGTGMAGGRIHAERVRRSVYDAFEGKLSVSAGVAEYRKGMQSPADLIHAADRALYRAKMDGRNRVCIDD